MKNNCKITTFLDIGLYNSLTIYLKAYLKEHCQKYGTSKHF